jgi:hypothetical protein
MKQILNFIASLRHKKRNQTIMSNNTEQLEKTRVFQWIKGDSFGKVVTLKEEDSEFLYFTDGSQIYKTVAKEFLLESLDGDMPLPDAKPLGNGSKVNSRTSIIAENVYEDKSPTQISQQIPQQISQQTPEETPLEQLIVKLSKKNSTTLNVPVELNLPRKEIVDLLVDNSEEYDRDAVLAIIVETTLNKININTLRETLKEQINSHLKNYYNE